MVDPATAMLIATAVSTAAKAGGDYLSGQSQQKQGKRRAKEAKRETHADLLHDALQRSSELEAHRLAGSQKAGKRRSQSMQDTANLVREAFSI